VSRKHSDRWLSERIERWFVANARPLPWRRRRTGWRALVSEIMLQQTQVGRVAERFESFMHRFPTPRAMSLAAERDVLLAWQGMGYYRRATLLRRAAIEIVERHGGRVPRSAAVLRALPGVGRYTAGAIASIVHGKREAIVDGNVARVLLRVRGVALPLRDARAQDRCWREAESIVLEAKAPGVLNEGLMELGATICTPTNPKCAACPIRAACAAHAGGMVDAIPSPPRRKVPRRERVDTLVAFDPKGARVVLVQRPPRGMWASMWETPAIEGGRAGARALLGATPSLARAARSTRCIGSFRHLTTHRDFRFRVFVATIDGSRPGADSMKVPRRPHAEVSVDGRAMQWVDAAALNGIPLSNAARRVLEMALHHRAARAR